MENKTSHAMIRAVINIICSIVTLILTAIYFIFGVKPIEPYESSSIPEITTTVSETTICITTETSYTSSSSTTVLTTTSETEITTETSYDPAYTTFIGYTVTTSTINNIVIIPDYEIIVITDKPKTTTKRVTTTKTVEITTTTTNNNVGDFSNKEFIKTFSRGTYYCYERTNVTGGSGRTLIDCSTGADIKGSVACRYIYGAYGYNHGSRTTVYLEIPEYPEMNGYYYVDDACASYDVIDFYYDYKNNCPFKNQGVISSISCYIVN